MDREKQRESFPEIIICFSMIIWFSTEILSAMQFLTYTAIRTIWIIFGLLSVLLMLKRMKSGKGSAWIYAKDKLKEDVWRGGQWFERLLSVLILLLALIMFILSYTIVPNNWDSMTYHMARVANWIQNRSVAYYSTSILRQLYYSNFTEYIILHLCLLLKSDKLVNIVQWLAYVLSAVMTYKISIKLGTDKRGALFSALLFMLCPLAIAESMTTQVDLLATMYLLMIAWFILKIGKSPLPLCSSENMHNIVFCACSIGFGYLTKSSICFMVPLLLLWLLLVCLKKQESVMTIFKSVVLAAGIIILLAFPSFVRNYKSTGNILALEQVAGNLMVKTISPRYLLLNGCKNLTLEIAGEEQPDAFWQMTVKLADYLQVDIEDLEISAYYGYSEGRGAVKSYHHDTAGARTLFLISGIVCIFAILHLLYSLIKKKKRKEVINLTYICSLLCSTGTMLFCIRWQPWGTRLLMPILPLICIFIGYTINAEKEYRYMNILVMSIVLLLMLPDGIRTIKMQADSYAQAVWDGEARFDLYFLNRQEETEPYRELTATAEKMGAKNIGLLLGGDTYEYPLWVALKNENTTIHPIVLSDKNIFWQPECILAVHTGDMEIGTCIEYGTDIYRCIWNYGENADYAILWAESVDRIS